VAGETKGCQPVVAYNAGSPGLCLVLGFTFSGVAVNVPDGEMWQRRRATLVLCAAMDSFRTWFEYELNLHGNVPKQSKPSFLHWPTRQCESSSEATYSDASRRQSTSARGCELEIPTVAYRGFGD
jgi:hypothetical protein